MTRKTALELTLRLDINRQLLAAGQEMTATDRAHLAELLARANVEDRIARIRILRRQSKPEVRSWRLAS